MDGGAWWAAVHGVARSRTRLSDFTLFFHFHALEKEMATHSSVLAWRIPGTWEPGGLPSVGLHRVGHDWSDLAAAAAAFTRKHYMYALIYDNLFFSFWLTSLCVTISRSIYVSANGTISFLFMAKWYSIVCMYIPHFLFPFLCWWTFRLLPCPFYCK